jgi:hypothetical protein
MWLTIAIASRSVADRVLAFQSPPPIVLGLYTKGYVGNPDIIDCEIRSLDTWAGKQHTLAGLFMNIQDENPAYNIGYRFQSLWERGYTVFLNLKTIGIVAELAGGKYDRELAIFAHAFADWAQRGVGKMAFIAPLQEMNIPAESYSLDRENFKLAYHRIQAASPTDDIAKNTWLRETYNYLANAPGVRGVLYFNIDKECDWAIAPQSAEAEAGYPAGVAHPHFGYVAPTAIGSMF